MGVSIFNTGYDLQDQIDAAESAIAIVSIGDTHVAITSGQYVYVREHGTLAEGLYRATANIAANGTLSGSNVTAVSGGGLNALNSNVDYCGEIKTIPETVQATPEAIVAYALTNWNLEIPLYRHRHFHFIRTNVDFGSLELYKTEGSYVHGLLYWKRTDTKVYKVSGTFSSPVVEELALNSKVTPTDGTLTFSGVNSDITISDTMKSYTKIGNIVILNITITASANLSAWADLFTITNSGISIIGQRTIAGNLPFYIGSNKVQNTTALPSGTYYLQFIVDIS